MVERLAECRCGQLTARCPGDPVRVSVCHCLSCQRRTGGVFAAQARFPLADVVITGEWRVWELVGDSGKKSWHRWCPECGATIGYIAEAMPDLFAIPTGAFADPDFPDPEYSVYENRKHRWVAIVGDDIEHN